MTDDAIGFAAVLGVLMVFFIAFFLLYGIPLLITNVLLYMKAGKPGWAVIVPVYSSVIEAEIGKKPVWMGWLVGVLSLISFFPDRADNGGMQAIGSLLGITSLVFSIILLVGFIKAYRASVGFWVAYFLLPILAVFLVKNVSYGAATVAAPMAPGTPMAPVAPVATGPVAPAQPQPQYGDGQATAQVTMPAPQTEAPVALTPPAYAPNPPVAPADDPTNPTSTPPTNPVA